jgi:hypothetical protein
LVIAESFKFQVSSFKFFAIVVAYWWGEAPDEPALARQSEVTAACEDARPTGKSRPRPLQNSSGFWLLASEF